MIKNILITGGLGHIGSKLIRDLGEYELTVVDNLLTQRYCSLFNIERKINFIDKGFEDLALSDLEEIDAVIHLGAVADAASSSKADKKLETWNVNVKHTKNFINLVSKSNVKLFIFPSSTSVYGKSIDIVYEDDESCVNPQSPYAESKIEIEKYLRKINLNSVVLRFGTIFGESIGMRFHTAINKFCYQASLGKSLTVWRENYEQSRPYLGLNDCIQSLKLILSNEDSWNNTYNVLTDNYTLKSIIDNIEGIIDVDIKFVDTPLLNQFSYIVDYSKIKRMGFKPKDNIKKSIKETIKLLK